MTAKGQSWRQDPYLALAPISVAIAINTAVSAAVDIRGLVCRGVAIEFPAEWTAANLGIDFWVSAETPVYIPLKYASGTRVVLSGIATAAVGLQVFPAEVWSGMRYDYLRLASLSTSDNATPVNQAAARTLKVSILA